MTFKAPTLFPLEIYVAEPKPNDNRPRNGFGILKGFGQAYSAYYKKQDKELTVPRGERRLK